jgi:quinol monooxygenase YgiN
MAYARVFVVRAHHGREQEVRDETGQLLEHFSQQPGFMAGWNLESQLQPDIIVRTTLWESREAADRAANNDRTMAIIGQIMSRAEDASIGSGVFDASVVLPGGVTRD